MAKIKAVLRPPKDKDGKKPIYIRIADAGKTRYVSTGQKVKPKYWNKRQGEVRENDEFEAAHVNKIIARKVRPLQDESYQLQADGQNVNADVLKQRAKSGDYRGDFIQYANEFAKQKKRINIRTGKKYTTVSNKVSEFCGGRLLFKDVTVQWLKDYSSWCADKKGNNPNTIHGDLRAIRAVLYDAIRVDLFPQEKNPFFKFRLTQPKVTKVKLTTSEIKALADVEPNGNPVQAMAKDMYLFSFFTFGMRFRDVCLLRWKNIDGNFIHYQMHKTEEAQRVKLFPPARTIVDKYRGDHSPDDFVFPLLNTRKNLESPEVLESELSSKNAYINKELYRLREAAGINKRFSFHTARHSYANIARDKGTNVYDISKRLGHASIQTTEIYLSQLENSTEDKTVEAAYEEFEN